MPPDRKAPRLSDLVDIEKLRGICESFTALTGAVTAIVDLEGNVLMGTGWKGICTDFHRVHPLAHARCVESDTVLATELRPGDSHRLYRCKNGLVDVAVPIVTGGEHVANFFTGQFFVEPPDRRFFEQQARELGFDADGYLAALDQVPVFDDKQVAALVAFFAGLTRMFGEMGLKQRHLQDMMVLHRQSQERFSLAMDATRDGLWDWDVDSGEVYYSPGYLAMLGYAPGEFPAHVSTWQDLIHPDDRKDADRINRDCLENRTTHFETEFRMQHKSGQWRWILGRGSAVSRHPDGRASRMIGTHTDITERKLAEARLRESEEKFSRAFEKAPVLIAISKLEDGTFLVVNEKFCEVTGYSREEIIGRSSIDLGFLTSEIRAEMGEELRAHGHTGNREVTIVAKGGKRLTVMMSGQLIRIGDHVRVLSTAVDLTRQKDLHAQLLHAQKMESMGRLAGGLAHDFNNKLMVMLGHADLAGRDRPDDAALQEHLEEIMNAARTSRDMIGQLLVFSRRQVISPRPLDVNECLDRSRKSLARLIGEDVRLSFTPGDGLWSVMMDPVQLDQTIMNLAVNARDAMPEGGTIAISTANVVIRAGHRNKDARHGEYVRITFRDTGCGMDAETLQHAFEPFFTTKPHGQGTGLGLATVYGIVTQNKGFIEIESEPHRGTEFQIHIPRHGERKAVRSAPAAKMARATGTVLLVEDEAPVRRLAREMLRTIGYTPIEASSGEEALEIAQREGLAIDLVLTDLVMPGMNGRQLARQLKALRPETKIVFMTGYGMVKGEGDESGLVLHKPFSIESLARLLEQAQSDAARASASEATAPSPTV